MQPVEDSMPKIDQYMMLTTGRNKLADLSELIVEKRLQACHGVLQPEIHHRHAGQLSWPG